MPIRSWLAAGGLGFLSLAGCGDSTEDPATPAVRLPLHLEDHIERATIEGSSPPEHLPGAVEWRFDEPQSGWQAAGPLVDGWEPVAPFRVDGALRIPLTDSNRNPRTRRFVGDIFVELGDWKLEEWSHVEIRARTSDAMRFVGLVFNYDDEDPADEEFPWHSSGERARFVTNGTVQTYRLSLEPHRPWTGPWTHLGVWFSAEQDQAEAVVDLLSVKVVPAEEEFAEEHIGRRVIQRRTPGVSSEGGVYRRSLFMHAPGRAAFRVRVPENGRLDLGLGVLRQAFPVTFGVIVTPPDGEAETLLDETYADAGRWGQRSVDLSHLAGRTVTLALETRSDRPATVALWGAPTLSGSRTTEQPNVILYVIDGAGADTMSVYGYNRRTTPNLERIAAEGALFERAYSNTPRTQTSTPSFLTSLQHSVLGGLRKGNNPVPVEVRTVAEHLHGARYQTALFTSNPNAGRISNLERGHDVFREAGVTPNSVSSVELHENFWNWREEFPGEPYWAHIQSTDVHEPHTPPAPFAGLYIDPERRRTLEEWDRLIGAGAGMGPGIWGGAFEGTGIDRVAYAAGFRDLYDETMAHQDHQLGRLVGRLKATGEWERTVLIVASDHGAAAGSQDWGMLMRGSVPAAFDFTQQGTPMFRSGVGRIPLIVVWPGRIAAGQRFDQPVSMIDVLPTVLDFAGLPMPEAMQGQSLAPLVLGQEGWEPRPVIFDEFAAHDETGELYGRIEVVDGRWGASLGINLDSAPGDDFLAAEQGRHNRLERSRPARLLVYDLWNDPQCLHSLHEERPDLVSEYTAFLEEKWELHRALATRFTPSGQSPLTPEQLETLHALGYISGE